MRLLICFDGTHLEGIHHEIVEDNTRYHDAVRIYFKGCHAPQTGGSGLFPNLEPVADRITCCFRQNELDLDQLKREFGDAIVIEPFDTRRTNPSQHSYGKISIEEMALAGYSRGCITALLTAKKLFEAQNKTPVRVMLNQPVPGNLYNGPFTLVSKVIDLRACTNIRSALVVAGRYAKQFSASGRNAVINVGHNLFFKQVVPFFSKETQTKLIECPIQSHNSNYGALLGKKYILEALKQYNYCLAISKNLRGARGGIKRTINTLDRIFLLNIEKRQPIYGNKDGLRIDPRIEKMLDKNMRDCVDCYNKHRGSQSKEPILLDALSFEQKMALFTLRERIDYREHTQTELLDMYSLILVDSPKGKKFIQVMNLSSCMIAQTLTHLYEKCYIKRARTKDRERLRYLEENKDRYLLRLFLIAYKYSFLTNPSQEDKKRSHHDLNENNKILLNESINLHQNPILDNCVMVIQNLVLGLLTLGGIFIYNAFYQNDVFFKKNTESYSQLSLGTEAIGQQLQSEIDFLI